VNLTRVDGYPRFAEQFASAGYAALVFDYRYLGDSAGEPRQLVDYQQQRQDLSAAVDYARSLDRITSDQIVLWGFFLVAATSSRWLQRINTSPLRSPCAHFWMA